MKVKSVIFTAALLLSSVAFAQTKSEKVDISWGAEQKASKKISLEDLVGYDESGFYALKSKKGHLFFLEHYNEEMNLVKSVELNLENGKDENTFEFIVQWNDQLLLFSSLLDKKSKKNNLYVQTINKESLMPNHDLRMVSQIDYEGRSKRSSGSFSYSFSEDRSKFLLYYALPYKKNETERYGFHVFDKNMDLVWEKQVDLPFEEGLFGIEEYAINDKGEVYLLGVAFKDKRISKRRGEPNYSYQILSYSDNGNTFKSFPVELSGHFLTDMQISINQENDIICAGFYSSEGTYSIKGSFFLRIDGESKKIEQSSFKEFELDFLTQNLNDRQVRRVKRKKEKGKDLELYEYDLNQLVMRDDGGAVLIGEQYYVSKTISTDANGNTTTTYHYHYNDIIAVNISPEGEIEWATKIPKKQVTSDDYGFYSSYVLAVVNDKLYFVFNDNGKNLFYKDGNDKLHNFTKNKESLITMVELDQYGNQTREALFSVRDADVLTRPKVCEQVSKNELILFGQRKKVHKFAKLTF